MSVGAASSGVVKEWTGRPLLTLLDRHASLVVLSFLTPVELARCVRVNKLWTLPTHNLLWKAHCAADHVPELVAPTAIESTPVTAPAASDVKSAPATMADAAAAIATITKAAATPAPAAAPAAAAAAAAATVNPARQYYTQYCRCAHSLIVPVPFDEATSKLLTEYHSLSGMTHFHAFRVLTREPASVSIFVHRLCALISVLFDEIPDLSALKLPASGKPYWSADTMCAVGIHGTAFHHTVRLFTVCQLYAANQHMKLYGDGSFYTAPDPAKSDPGGLQYRPKDILHPKSEYTHSTEVYAARDKEMTDWKTHCLETRRALRNSRAEAAAAAAVAATKKWPDPMRSLEMKDLHVDAFSQGWGSGPFVSGIAGTKPYALHGVHSEMNWMKYRPGGGWMFGIAPMLQPSAVGDTKTNGDAKSKAKPASDEADAKSPTQPFHAFVFLNRIRGEVIVERDRRPDPSKPPTAAAGIANAALVAERAAAAPDPPPAMESDNDDDSASYYSPYPPESFYNSKDHTSDSEPVGVRVNAYTKKLFEKMNRALFGTRQDQIADYRLLKSSVKRARKSAVRIPPANPPEPEDENEPYPNSDRFPMPPAGPCTSMSAYSYGEGMDPGAALHYDFHPFESEDRINCWAPNYFNASLQWYRVTHCMTAYRPTTSTIIVARHIFESEA